MRHNMSTASTIPVEDMPEHQCLMIEEFGEPVDKVVLRKNSPDYILPKHLGSRQILIENIAACVNPADINLIQGVYGIKPKLPAIIGNEGVARVKMVGTDVTHLSPGDLAVGVFGANAYWQNYNIGEADSYLRINKNLTIDAATQVKVNPCTAYRMIKDFYPLSSGDTIIQNGANSAVGVYTIQLAKLWGYKTINVIRDRPNRDEVVAELKDYGADVVLTEEEVGKVEVMKPILESMGKPKLFLNCVGGKNAANCQRSLHEGGVSVTYGAMSKQPFSLSATSLIFKDHKFFGFWVSRWYSQRNNVKGRPEVESMLNEICSLFLSGKLKPKRSTMIKFEERNVAFQSSNNTKFVFSINEL